MNNEKELRIIHKFFSEDEIKFIKDYSRDIFKKDILFTDKTNNWAEHLNTSPGRVEIYNIHETIDPELYKIISRKVNNEFGMEIKGCAFFFWLNNSNINWHNDAGHGGAATIYLNEKWKKEWGGFFIYKKDKKFGIEKPEYNKCVFQSGGIDHATTPVNKDAPIRKSLQVFFK